MQHLITLATRTLLLLLTAHVAPACNRGQPVPTPLLLDSPSPASHPELTRLRQLQNIQTEARLSGCVDSSLLGDTNQFPRSRYFFAEQPEGQTCPEGCSKIGLTCTYDGTSCDDFSTNEPAECRPSEWISISTSTAAEPGILGGICANRGFEPNCMNVSGSCEASVCYALSHLCRANAGLELASVRTRPLEVSIELGDALADLRITSQSTATNAGLVEAAAFESAQALEASMRALHSGLEIPSHTGFAPCSPTTLEAPIDAAAAEPSIIAQLLHGQTPAEIHARTVVDAYKIYQEAIQRTVKLNIAFADAQRRDPNLGVSVANQQTAPILSRSWAAHLLVGGTNGLPESQLASGLCTTAELSEGASACLELFRQAGMCPADIMDRNPLQALPNGNIPQDAEYLVDIVPLLEAYGDSNGMPSAGSLCARLEEQTGEPCNIEWLHSRYGVTLEDCQQARAYLEQEILAFGRPQDWTFPAEYDENNEPLFALFSAVRTPPREPNSMYYAALARNDATTRTVRLDSLPEPSDLLELISTSTLEVQNAVDMSDIVLSLTTEALTASYPGAPETKQVVDAPLNALAADITRELHGRLYLCHLDDATVDAKVIGFDEDSQLLLVYGEAGLSCAVNGNVDGAPCTLASGPAAPVSTYPLDLAWQTAATGVGFAKSAQTGPIPVDVAADTSHYYLVGPKPSLQGQPLSPGDYQALTVAKIPAVEDDCAVAPINTELFRQAGAILTPSPEWCSHPSIECDGTKFNERLPLEDELSDDSDGVESSWRHYLALAKQAAAEADLLAQQYVEAGIALDQREEDVELLERSSDVAAVHELETLQRICGSSIDPVSVLRNLQTQGEDNDFTAIEFPPTCPSTSPDCTCAGLGSCPLGSSCYAGRCIADPELEILRQKHYNPEGAELHRCLTDGDVYSAVTPGNTNLCYWRDPTNRICAPPEDCEVNDDGHCVVPECPQVEPEAGCSSLSDPFGVPMLTTDATLDYFPVSEPGGAPGSSIKEACDLLRDFRETPAAKPSDAGTVLASIDGARDLFHHNNLIEYGNLIGFTAKPGSYVDVTIGGAPWYSNGSIESGPPSSEWPCTQDPKHDCPNHPSSLFCYTNTCASERNVRRFFNERLIDAVYTLRALSILAPDGISGAGIRAPLANLQDLVVGWDTRSRQTFHPFEDDTPMTLLIRTSENGTLREWDSPYVLWSVGGSSATKLREGPPALTIDDPQNALLNPWGFMSKNGVGSNGACSTLVAGHLAASPSCPTFKIAIENGVEASQNAGGGPIRPETVTVGRNQVLDAAELYCEAREHLATGTIRKCNREALGALQVNSAADLTRISNLMLCMAEDTQDAVARSLLVNFPQSAADALREASSLGIYPALKGEMAEAVASLRATLIELYSAGPLIGSVLSQVGYDIDTLRLLLERKDLQSNLNEVVADQQRWSEIGNCVIATAAAGDAAMNKNMGGAAATATCINSAIQISFISKIRQIEDAIDDTNSEISILEVRRSFEQRADTLSQIASTLASAQERLDASLAHIENLRLQAKRSLANAMWLHSFQASQQHNINSAMRRRFNTERVRYEQALDYAQRMAFLAKRAIEARLGLRLESLDAPLPLAPAPSTWANSICVLQPIDYDAVRTETLNLTQKQSNYADAFIGSYVRNLEAVVESYRLTSNFHEGADTSVVSLRDDVFDVRSSCPSTSQNRLANSAHLSSGDSWHASGCADSGDTLASDCVSVTESADSPGSAMAPSNSRLVGHLFTFGPGPQRNGDYTPCEVGCDLTAEARWQQEISLEGGTEYTLSWYAKKVESAGSSGQVNPSGETSVAIFSPEGVELPGSAQATTTVDGGWARYVRVVTTPVDVTGDYTVAVVASAVPNVLPHQVLVSGLMIESSYGLSEPSEFEATDADGLTSRQDCEDGTGSEFRATRWEPGCVLLCDTGFSGDCAEGQAAVRCYKETSFSVGQRELEHGTLLSRAGFATGNFNYRIESLAVNFVGTELRNCSGVELAQTCYSLGSIPYSVTHRGPYFVRNHEGQNFEVPLFTGNIEHARGLATERYITNPISESDQSLLEQYTRHEFQGRPLDGNFTIRVWDDEGFDFSQIQDVQLILKYRYWTRFD